MDESGFPRTLRPLIIRAVSEAQRRGDSAVEAEHLLLALADDTDKETAATLAAAGLDHAGVIRALRAERVASLESAGVAPVPEERLVSTPRVTRPRWGASARQALVIASRMRTGPEGRRRMAEKDLAIALLDLQLGTVPRALELAGVDRRALVAALSH
jgi:ATP-dependent Clp protease ATP-binding subunit ClpA